MSTQIYLSNEALKVTISTSGAEFKSIIKDGKELLWSGDPSVWPGQAPVLFPICGGLKNDKFIFKDKEYTQPRHGFARRSEFEVENVCDNKATFLLTSNEETLKNYPFNFEFRVTYKLDGSKISVEYDVRNTSDEVMYFSVGSHEAYSCPNGVEEYSVIFEKPEAINTDALYSHEGLMYKAQSPDEGISELKLKNEYFENDALVFTELNSRKVTLKNNSTGYSIEVAFPGKDYFLIWTKPGASYICLEPWCGIADTPDTDYDFTKKKGINPLNPGSQFVVEHTITF